MRIIYRSDLSSPMTWDQLDENFRTVESIADETTRQATIASEFALESRQASEASQQSAQNSERWSEEAQAKAGSFSTVEKGLLNTDDGQLFGVLSAESDDVLDIYENSSGTAIYTGKSTPSTQLVRDLEHDFRGIFKDTTEENVLVSVTDKLGVPTWMEARSSDGGPTEKSKALLRKGIAGLPEEGDVSGVGISFQDSKGRKTWLQTSIIDGGLTAFATECVRQALGTPEPVDIGYVAEGDSMTASNYGGGVPYPTTLAELLGKPVANTGVSGAWSPEVSVRAGGITPLLTIPGGEVPAGTAAITVSWDVQNAYTGAGRVPMQYSGKIRGIACTLIQDSTAGTIALSRLVAGTALPIASPVPFIVDVPNIKKRHIVWSGRNDVPKANAYAPIDQLLHRLELEGAPYLLVSVCNSSTQPAGSAGYLEITALNLQLLKRAPLAYVDMRGRMIREGLALAGLTATAADNTAISEDRIPPSLLDDGLHFNPPGRLACAKIIYNELVLRGMA